MVIDTSAVVAILAKEPEARLMLDTIAMAASRRLSAGSLIELSAVVTRKKLASVEALNAIIAGFETSIEDVTPEQALIGQHACRSFGIGSGHPARLTFGDCFAYALAKATGEPLLFKGDDFARTDITPAL